MLLFAAHQDVHLAPARCKGPKVTLHAEQEELSHVSEVEAYTAAVRASVLAYLVPDDVGFVSELPNLHDGKCFQKESVGTPQVKMAPGQCVGL